MAGERTIDGFCLTLKPRPGGIAAWADLLHLLWGEDRIELPAGRLVVTRIRGPFRTSLGFERATIRRILLAGRGDRLTLETARGRVELSRLGTHAERFMAAVAIRTKLGLPEHEFGATAIPRGWEEIITPEGERALVVNLATRRIQAGVAGAVALLLTAVTHAVARASLHDRNLVTAALFLLASTLGLAALAVWLARGRWEWRIGSGRLTLRRRFGAAAKDVFEARRLVLEKYADADTDGDYWYELVALADESWRMPPGLRVWFSRFPNGRTVARRLNDASRVRDLGAWLARATGLELEDRTAPFGASGSTSSQGGIVVQWETRIRVDRVRSAGDRGARPDVPGE